jgi:hypothetical protein
VVHYPVLNDEHVTLWLEADNPLAFRVYGTGVPLSFQSDKGLSHRLLQALPTDVEGIYTPYLTSRSHTAGLGVMLITPIGMETFRVGVDIERQQRPTPSEKLIRRIAPSIEEYTRIRHLPPLGLWCIKEAVFKAWPNNTNGVLSQLKVQSVYAHGKDTWYGNATPLQGQPIHWWLQPLFPPEAHGPLWLAVAWVNKEA